MKEKTIKYEKVGGYKVYIKERKDNMGNNEYSVICNYESKNHPIFGYYWFYSLDNAFTVFHKELAELYEQQLKKREDFYNLTNN